MKEKDNVMLYEILMRTYAMRQINTLLLERFQLVSHMTRFALKKLHLIFN
jgi:hypothetical protein